MINREICCCFSGHRPQKLPWGMRETDERCIMTCNWIADQLEDLYSRGYRIFISGMAIGCDTFFAGAVLELKSRHDDVRLIAAIPCADQASRWNSCQKEKYSRLLEQCDEIKIFSDSYTPSCMQTRNKFMVDNSSALIACYSGRPGGTMKTILYAEREGLDVRILDLYELQTQ